MKGASYRSLRPIAVCGSENPPSVKVEPSTNRNLNVPMVGKQSGQLPPGGQPCGPEGPGGNTWPCAAPATTSPKTGTNPRTRILCIVSPPRPHQRPFNLEDGTTHGKAILR